MFDSYGPPNYYPPPEPVYGVPHAMLGLLDKFKVKLDLFTLAKILLKLILFKKLVSFIAIICLFLFIPWLKHEKGDDDEKAYSGDFRSISNENGMFIHIFMQIIDNKSFLGDDRINRLTTFVWESFKKYDGENKNNSQCDTIYCKTRKVISEMDSSLSYGR